MYDYRSTGSRLAVSINWLFLMALGEDFHCFLDKYYPECIRYRKMQIWITVFNF